MPLKLFEFLEQFMIGTFPLLKLEVDPLLKLESITIFVTFTMEQQKCKGHEKRDRLLLFHV